jgi:hypothetical protein
MKYILSELAMTQTEPRVARIAEDIRLRFLGNVRGGF